MQGRCLYEAPRKDIMKTFWEWWYTANLVDNLAKDAWDAASSQSAARIAELETKLLRKTDWTFLTDDF